MDDMGQWPLSRACHPVRFITPLLCLSQVLLPVSPRLSCTQHEQENGGLLIIDRNQNLMEVAHWNTMTGHALLSLLLPLVSHFHFFYFRLAEKRFKITFAVHRARYHTCYEATRPSSFGVSSTPRMPWTTLQVRSSSQRYVPHQISSSAYQ